MRENVRKFVEMISNGTDIMYAANETGVVEMQTYDLLSEISVILGGKKYANTIRSISESFLNWVSASTDMLDAYGSLKSSIGSINEIDNALTSINKETK